VGETANTRARILDAAETLFARNGFDATATSAIATLAAVPKGLLFYYFPAKTDLLRALVGERMDAATIEFESVVEHGNPVRSLLNLASRLREAQHDSDVLRVIIWREERTHPEVRASLGEHRRHLQDVVERVLQQSLGKAIPTARLRVAARAWVAVLADRSIPDRPANQPSDAERSSVFLAEVAELICDGLLHEAASPAR
jgi:AcrR family transcriptional regulator